MNTFKKILFSIFFILISAQVKSLAGNEISEYYQALRSNDTSRINKELMLLEKSVSGEKDAKTGALLMKKAEFLKQVSERLSTFKKGRKLLQASIKSDSTNAEYRFLRLIIQEKCPDFLNYHSNRKEDSKIIQQSFKKISSELQKIIRDYSATSQTLKPEELAK